MLSFYLGAVLFIFFNELRFYMLFDVIKTQFYTRLNLTTNLNVNSYSEFRLNRVSLDQLCF